MEQLVAEVPRLLEQGVEVATEVESLREVPLVEPASLLLEREGEVVGVASLQEGALAVEALRPLEQGVEVVTEIVSLLEEPLVGGAMLRNLPLAWTTEEMTPLCQESQLLVVVMMATQRAWAEQEASLAQGLGLVKGPLPTVPKGMQANE